MNKVLFAVSSLPAPELCESIARLCSAGLSEKKHSIGDLRERIGSCRFAARPTHFGEARHF
jgi:hypothetical protein